MKIKLILLLLLFSTFLFSQDEKKGKHYFHIDYGLNHQSILEQRFSSLPLHFTGFNTRLAYSWENEKSLQSVTTDFSKTTTKGKVSLFFNVLNPELRYTNWRLRKDKNIHFGGYWDAGTVLQFPSGNWAGDNEISYTIWSSLGLSALYRKEIQLFNRPFLIKGEASFPLFTYLIRPAYGFPYSENFLQDGIFDFKRTGLGGYIIKSGKLRTVNAFQNVKLNSSLALPLTAKQHQIGLHYQWSFLYAKGEKSISYAQHHLTLFLKIRL